MTTDTTDTRTPATTGPVATQLPGTSQRPSPKRPLSKRHWMALALENSGCAALLSRLPTWQGVLILNYHRIGDCSQSLFDHELWSATAENFDDQLTLLRSRFDVISLPELGSALQNKRGRSVLLTFDDGYADNYQIAYPILRRHGLSATFFLATGFLDRPTPPWWDEVAWMVRTSAVDVLDSPQWIEQPIALADQKTAIRKLLNLYKRLPFAVTEDYLNHLAEVLGCGRCPVDQSAKEWMTWDNVREMAAGGMSFGAHTVTHPVLANCSAQQQGLEIGQSKARIEAELQRPVTSLSYPVGGPHSFNDTTHQIMRQQGLEWGFTYFGGYVSRGAVNPYTLGRAAVELDIDRALFRAVTTLPNLF